MTSAKSDVYLPSMRVFISLLLCFFVFAEVLAVETDTVPAADDRFRLYAGWRFGFGGAKQTNTIVDRASVNWAVNPNMGAVAWLRFQQNFGLMLEAQYSLKGYRFRQNSGDSVIQVQQRYHFLEFPILLHASIGNSRFTEFIEFGIAPSYLMGGYRETSTFQDDVALDVTYDNLIFNKPFPFPVKRFDLNMIIGGGLGVKIGPGLLHTGIRYQLGLIDIYKEDRFGSNGERQLQRNFSLHFGYLWHIRSYK